MSSSVSIHSKGHDVHISTSWLREDRPFDVNNTRLLQIKTEDHEVTIFLDREDKICFMPEKY
jgi:hypothetical protein